ncbi:hypothetical protein HNO88_003686 [Novosphingobium chloroacetimidivorans]|uniref:Uncharacterized protein n=1 Tax=Novosphingobium chloroacetimidivorans TaxID=1428314 RepID=A0A7W7KE05_9SPHN|nr:hypothetical protein [Novosphingobium chloroacetimidivorans]MBB4860343.1 hypothetical protein [Novosphingobium chloroacetimidivorans]
MIQTVTLLNWITIDHGLGDLTALVPQLEALTAFVQHWRAIGAEVAKLAAGAPVDSPGLLAGYLATHVGGPAIGQVFATLGLDELHAKLADLGGELASPDAPWAKLLQPASAFLESYGATPAGGAGLDDGDNPGLVSSPLSKLAEDAAPVLGKATLSFAIGAAAELECEAGAV